MCGHIGQLEGSWGGVVGLPQPPLAQLLFLPGQFDVLYEKQRISPNRVFWRCEPPRPALFTSLIILMHNCAKQPLQSRRVQGGRTLLNIIKMFLGL